MGFFIFVAVFTSAMVLMNLYVWRHIVKQTGKHFRWYLWFIPVLLIGGDIIYITDLITGILPDNRVLYLAAASCIGITFMLFFVALIYDASLRTSARIPYDASRRRTIKLIFDVTIIIMAFSYLLRGFAQGLKLPGVKKVSVKVKDFELDNFSIVQLTDVHVGRTIKRDFIEQLVAKVNKIKPDIIVITGDLVDWPIHQIEYDLYPLSELEAPTYFIFGNHEYFHGAGEAAEYMRELGIRPLLNESVSINKNGKQFNLVGLNDVSGLRAGFYPPDTEAAYTEVDESLPCIVLAHQPKMINEMGDRRCDLMLSGHTHGGQIFPFGLLVQAAQPYVSGLHQHNETQQIYVSRGTGYWGPPIRVFAPSEISHIRITSA